MESRIPLPTDNIFKFYALFGLALFITCAIGLVFVSTSTNEKNYMLMQEQVAISNSLEPEKKEVLEAAINRLIEVNIENKGFFNKVLGGLAGLALVLMGFGFWQWHHVVQPKQDEYFDLQLKKLRHETEKPNS